MNLKNIFSNLFRPSRAQLEHRAAALIAAGKIPEAIQALMDAGHTDAALLKARWDALMLRRQTEPNLDWETFTITQNRITFALLEMSKPQEARANPGQTAEGIEHGAKGVRIPEAPKLTEEQRAQLRQLLEQEQWLQALELGKDWNNELMLTHGRYQNLERDYCLGLVTEETYQNTRRKILDALRYFADFHRSI